MSRNAEQLGALVLCAAKRGEPVAAAAENGRRDGHRLDVGDGRRAAKDTNVGRERRLEARLAGLALNALNEGGLLAANVRAGAAVDVNVKVVAGAARILANEAL